MSTDQDIEKFKTVFATKEEWRPRNEVIANEFNGLVQLMGEMEERLIVRMDQKILVTT